MSRICVKKIGRNVDEKALRELFSSKGEVTDVKVARKPDGSSRMFAFVGFRTEQQALEAQRYFDNTFIGLSRISVEIARKLNDKELAERKQKHAKPTTTKVQELREKAQALEESERERKSGGKNNKQEKEQEKKKESKYKTEFMDLVTGKASRILAPEETAEEAEEEAESAHTHAHAYTHAEEAEREGEEDSDEESAIDLGDLLARQKSETHTHTHTDLSTAKPLSDLDYLRSKMARDRALSFSSDSESDAESERETKRESKKERETESTHMDDDDEHSTHTQDKDEEEGNDKEDAEHTETNANTEQEQEQEEEDARLIVKNLPFTVSEDELRELFSVYGNITEVHIPLSPPPERKSKGFAFVTFLFPDHATRALEELHGAAFQGRVLYVSRALRPVERVKEEDALLSDLNNSRLSVFQRKKEEERRKAAQKREGWNAAFVRSDAVVESLAAQYGVDQAAILDTTLAGGAMAVRLAIGESQVIQDNKTYFATHGVDLNALESINSTQRSVLRSTTTLLVKNLPPDTVLDELESMFARFGVLANFLSPPSKTVAIVDFEQPSEARAAFKGLAYRRYKNSPLYLEWAPLQAIDKKKMEEAKQQQLQKEKEKQKEKGDDAPTSSSAAAAAEVDNMEDFSSLFIKNLNFSTTEDGLREHLLRLGVRGLRTVVIQKKFKGQVMLSQGFGFAEFQNAHYAQQALQRMNNSVLDSHKLEVKPSDKRLTAAPAALAKDELQRAKNAKNSSKLIVRNLAFQATKAELRALFAAFGSVKTVRIPKKMGGNHRGFAFVELATSQEAANAMAALKNTHLYGRHLVLEWAKAGDDDEDDGDEDAPRLVSKSMEASRKRALQDQKVISAVHQKAKRQKAVDGGEEDTGDVGELM